MSLKFFTTPSRICLEGSLKTCLINNMKMDNGTMVRYLNHINGKCDVVCYIKIS